MSIENESDDITTSCNSQYSFYRELTKYTIIKDKFNTRKLLRPQINIDKNAFRRIIAGVYKGFLKKNVLILRENRCPHLRCAGSLVLSRSPGCAEDSKRKWNGLKQERRISYAISLYLENHKKMPLQISDKTFKRFPLVLNTSLWAYFPRFAIDGSCYKSPTVELVSYFEREFLPLNHLK